MFDVSRLNTTTTLFADLVTCFGDVGDKVVDLKMQRDHDVLYTVTCVDQGPAGIRHF